MDFLYSLDYDDERGELKASQESHKPEHKFGEESFENWTFGYSQPTVYDPISLLINAKVYIIAEKYDIQALKELACAKYKEVWQKSWNSAHFTESASLVYENTVEEDKMLRDVIVKAASDNIKALLDRGEFVELLKSYGDFATDILKNVVCNPDSTDYQEIGDQWGNLAFTKKGRKKGHGW